MRAILPLAALALLITSIVRADDSSPLADADRDLSRQVSRLVDQLNDDRGVQRDVAEKKLLELAGDSAAQSDRVIALLPEANDQMPLAVRERLTRIRQKIEDRTAKSAVEGTTVALNADKMPLTEVFAAIEKQTGNKLKDNRQQDPAEADAAGNITIELKDEPFWSAVDKILDEANLGVYNFGGEDALAVVARNDNEGPRHGKAAYVGPFRMEILEIQAQRNSRQPAGALLKLQLEIAWEPRLHPIAISQPAADLTATDDADGSLTVNQPEATLDVEVANGTQAAEIVLPLAAPPRSVSKIKSLKGKLMALVPGRQEKFRFGDLANAAGKSQRRGGVEVIVDDVRKNNEIWEVHMRMKLDEDNHAFESHRNWAFQNVSVLETKDGETIDNAGLETTKQTPNEVGVAYLFDLPEGIEGLTWVYQTPAAIVELPIEYELKDIELP